MKAETRQEHEALEQALDLLRPDITLNEYGVLLQRFHMFHSAFDAFVHRKSINGWDSASFYCQDRNKSDWLLSDLIFLGINPEENGLSSICLEELLPTNEHVWGAVYVIEGSTLGGAVLAKHFALAFGLSDTAGLKFFTSYGKNTARMWNLTLDSLKQCEEQGAAQHAVVEGAKRIFNLLGKHLPQHNREGARHA